MTRKEYTDARLTELENIWTGEPLTQEVIADFCGVSKTAIRKIERSAEKKIVVALEARGIMPSNIERWNANPNKRRTKPGPRPQVEPVREFEDWHDYRDSDSARALLRSIEKLVKTVRTTRLRYINERIEMPRGWSLLDLIATSEKLELVPGYFDVVVYKQCEKGIPPVEEFQVAKRWNGLLLPDLGLS